MTTPASPAPMVGGRVAVRDDAGAEVGRGKATAFTPASYTVQFDDGSTVICRADLVVVVTESADASATAVLAQVERQTAGQGWTPFLASLRAAGYDVVRRTRASTPAADGKPTAG